MSWWSQLAENANAGTFMIKMVFVSRSQYRNRVNAKYIYKKVRIHAHKDGLVVSGYIGHYICSFKCKTYHDGPKD